MGEQSRSRGIRLRAQLGRGVPRPTLDPDYLIGRDRHQDVEEAVFDHAGGKPGYLDPHVELIRSSRSWSAIPMSDQFRDCRN